jgi:hypothetical protein
MKLKKGDIVWVRIPVNAKIVSINKRYGYTILVNQEQARYQYFGDDEVEKVPVNRRGEK